MGMAPLDCFFFFYARRRWSPRELRSCPSDQYPKWNLSRRFDLLVDPWRWPYHDTTSPSSTLRWRSRVGIGRFTQFSCPFRRFRSCGEAVSEAHRRSEGQEAERAEKRKMSGVTDQEVDKKPADQAGHINLKVKGQVLSLSLSRRSSSLYGLLPRDRDWIVWMNLVLMCWILFVCCHFGLDHRQTRFGCFLLDMIMRFSNWSSPPWDCSGRYLGLGDIRVFNVWSLKYFLCFHFSIICMIRCKAESRSWIFFICCSTASMPSGFSFFFFSLSSRLLQLSDGTWLV